MPWNISACAAKKFWRVMRSRCTESSFGARLLSTCVLSAWPGIFHQPRRGLISWSSISGRSRNAACSRNGGGSSAVNSGHALITHVTGQCKSVNNTYLRHRTADLKKHHRHPEKKKDLYAKWSSDINEKIELALSCMLPYKQVYQIVTEYKKE